jgi:hypothetical protein
MHNSWQKMIKLFLIQDSWEWKNWNFFGNYDGYKNPY